MVLSIKKQHSIKTIQMFNKSIIKGIVSIFLLGITFNLIAQEDIDFTEYRMAMKYKRLGEYEEAIQYFDAFIFAYPEFPKAYYFRGYTHYYLEDYKAALKDFLQQCESDVRNPEAFYSAAKVYNKIGKYEEAIEYYSAAIALDPFHAYALNDRGMSYCKLNNFDGAIQDFHKAVLADSTLAIAYNNLGTARYFNQDVEIPSKRDLLDAHKWFSKAIHFDNTSFLGYVNRAIMNYFLEDYTAAAADLMKATSLDPTEPTCYFYFGMVYTKQKEFGKALNSYQRALDLNPNLKFAYEEMGNLERIKKSYYNALDYYEKAKAVDPDEEVYIGLIDYRMAAIYALQKREDAMYRALKMAKANKVFNDKKVFQDFLREKAFKKFRAKKGFQKFAKSIRKGKKYNKFVGSELNWFRMTL